MGMARTHRLGGAGYNRYAAAGTVLAPRAGCAVAKAQNLGSFTAIGTLNRTVAIM